MAISIVSPTEPYNPDKEREGGAAYKSMLNDMTEEARDRRNKPNKFTQFMNAAGQVMGMIKDVQGINNAELQRKQHELQLEREKNTTKIQSIQAENELQNLEKDNKWLESFSTYFESQDLDKLHDFALSDISQLSRHPSERNVLIAKLKQAGYDTSIIESVDMDQYNKNQLNNARIFAAYNRGRGSSRSKAETSGLSKEQKQELEFQKNQTVKEAGAFASLAELANNNPEFRQGLADIGITNVDDPLQFYQEFVQKGCQAKIVQTQQGNDTKEASKGTANLNNALLSSKLENLRSNLTNSNTGSSNPATIQLSCNQDDGTRISVEVPADLNSKLPIRTYSGIGESNGGIGELLIDVNPKNTNLGNILSVVNNSTTRWRKTSDRDKPTKINTDPTQTNTSGSDFMPNTSYYMGSNVQIPYRPDYTPTATPTNTATPTATPKISPTLQQKDYTQYKSEVATELETLPTDIKKSPQAVGAVVQEKVTELSQDPDALNSFINGPITELMANISPEEQEGLRAYVPKMSIPIKQQIARIVLTAVANKESKDSMIKKIKDIINRSSIYTNIKSRQDYKYNNRMFLEGVDSYNKQDNVMPIPAEQDYLF